MCLTFGFRKLPRFLRSSLWVALASLACHSDGHPWSRTSGDVTGAQLGTTRLPHRAGSARGCGRPRGPHRCPAPDTRPGPCWAWGAGASPCHCLCDPQPGSWGNLAGGTEEASVASARCRSERVALDGVPGSTTSLCPVSGAHPEARRGGRPRADPATRGRMVLLPTGGPAPCCLAGGAPGPAPRGTRSASSRVDPGLRPPDAPQGSAVPRSPAFLQPLRDFCSLSHPSLGGECHKETIVRLDDLYRSRSPARGNI